MPTHWDRSEWYKVRGNCPLVPPVSCSYFLDTHVLGIHVFVQEICTHTHTFMSIFYIQSLFPEPFCLLSAGHQEAAQSERRRVQLSSLTNMDSRHVSLTTASPYFNPPRICFQSHFPKILLSSGPCPQSTMFPAVCFYTSPPNFQRFFILLQSIYLSVPYYYSECSPAERSILSSPGNCYSPGHIWAFVRVLLLNNFSPVCLGKCPHRLWLVLALCRWGNWTSRGQVICYKPHAYFLAEIKITLSLDH